MWKHQKKAYESICKVLETNDRCLVKMFCGTGKTLIVFRLMMELKHNLAVIVFPSISLITQFNEDYIRQTEYVMFNYITICSKDELNNGMPYTTDIKEVETFLKSDYKKIIMCTYQSMKVLSVALHNTKVKVNMMIYDEAHHVVGDVYQDLVFGKTINNKKKKKATYDHLHIAPEKTIFLTATPKNDNGVVMFLIDDDTDYDYDPNKTLSITPPSDTASDSGSSISSIGDTDTSDTNSDTHISIPNIPDVPFEQTSYFAKISNYIREKCIPDTTCTSNGLTSSVSSNSTYTDVRSQLSKAEYIYSDCGVLAYEYHHSDAVLDNICKDYEIYVNFHSNERSIIAIYKHIIRNILQTGNNRVLTLHNYVSVQKDGKISVNEFVNHEEFMATYVAVVRAEFPDRKKSYKSVIINGVTAATKNKREVLRDFENTKDDEIYVLSSCNTIGEGVDTKMANSICFVDPRQSPYVVMQNIGRVCRKVPGEDPNRKSSILLSCYVDPLKYSNTLTEEERSELIKKDMASNGDFVCIANVLGAIKIAEPRLFNLYLKYDTRFAPCEIRINLGRHGLIIKPSIGDIFTTIAYMADRALPDGECSIRKLSIFLKTTICIHGLSFDKPIRKYGDYDKNIIIYHDTARDMFFPVVTKLHMDRYIHEKQLNIPVPTRKQYMLNSSFDSVEFDISENEMKRGYVTTYNSNDMFMNKYVVLSNWVNEHERIPSVHGQTTDEKRLGIWCRCKRRDKTNGRLSVGKQALLEHIPGWYWNDTTIIDSEITNDLTGSTLLEVSLNGSRINIKKYKHLLIEVYKQLDINDLIRLTTFNIKTEEYTTEGYVYNKELQISIQNKESNNTMKEIIHMCSTFNIPLSLKIKLRDNNIIDYKNNAQMYMY